MSRSLRPLVVALALNACDSVPSSPPDAAAVPRLNFMNGPNELPHVVRFEQRTVIGWVDLDRNMGIIIGQSLIPGDPRLCGGPTRSQFLPMQLVGDLVELDAAIKQLAQNPAATVLVYDEAAPSLEEALCESEPAAVGVGLYRRLDNDLLGTGGNRSNAVIEHLNAAVELTGGGSGIVNAWLRLRGQRGVLISEESSIRLTPTGN